MTLNNLIPRSLSTSSTIHQDIQRSAKKAATFGVLSACANRRLPSRVSRRVCSINIRPSVDRTRNPWSFNPRRSSQARVDHLSRARIPTATSVARTPAGPSNPAPSPLSTQPPASQKSCPFPLVSTLARPSPPESRCLSLTARSRRVPTPSGYPPLQISSSAAKYTLDISLPAAIKPEMVTITTAKGDILKIVADAWHLESDCHFEWEIVFPPQDVDIASISAKFDARGRLTVNAGRRTRKN
ncbi:hypothetical protein C8R46DRAFT_943005 [Mycena filopes]|nr:hypothetical protein C8R46DRAFT_943005 [Mycena filopes]